MDDKTTGKEGKTERKKKRVGNKYLDKRNYCVGTEPSEYIGILVTSTITGHGGSVVSVLDSQAKGKGFISQLCLSFFPTSICLSSLSNLCRTW